MWRIAQRAGIRISRAAVPGLSSHCFCRKNKKAVADARPSAAPRIVTDFPMGAALLISKKKEASGGGQPTGACDAHG